MNIIALLPTMWCTAVSLEQVVQRAPCISAGSGQRCASEELETEDHNVLLQHAASPRHSGSSVFEERHMQLSQADSAANMLSDVLLGNVPKSEVEIVLAHYNEDIEWSNPYSSIRTIYCKGPHKSRPPGCHPLKNVGREGHTYLHHIVHNYDSLSKWTVFTQAQAPTQGYRGHRRGGGHALPGVPFDAFVLPEEAGGLSREDGSAFIFTGAVHMSTLNHSLRLSYIRAAHAPTLHQQSKCPKTELLDGWQKWWDLGWFKKFIGGRCNVAAAKVPKFFTDYWDSVIKLPRPANDILFFTQGARFAASRERIQQRPKAFYEELLQTLDHDLDPCQNYFNEWAWYYIVGKPDTAETSPCSVDLVISEANNKQKEDVMLFDEMASYKKAHSTRWKYADVLVEEEAADA